LSTGQKKNPPPDSQHPYHFKKPRSFHSQRPQLYKFGFFRPTGRDTVNVRPFIRLTFSHVDRHYAIDTLIDTGSSHSVINPVTKLILEPPQGNVIQGQGIGQIPADFEEVVFNVILPHSGENMEQEICGLTTTTNLEYNIIGMDFLKFCKLELRDTKSVELTLTPTPVVVPKKKTKK